MISATWTKIAAQEHLQRSSLTATTIGSTLLIFGGELVARQPRDSDLLVVDVEVSEPKGADNTSIRTITATQDSPSPRVGAASTSLNGRVYIFGGRGGPDMSPIDELGCVWEFQVDSSTKTWRRLSPQSASSPVPQARSYHCMTSDGRHTIFVHAGCPTKGRLSDFWSFNVPSREWRQLASAPEPARGGPSITWADGKIYRMNGFDGMAEQGGQLDVYDPTDNVWSSINYTADGKSGPGPRSVSALLSLRIGGKVHLVTPMGESDPSALGHQGAGKMLSDVWAYSIQDGEWSQINETGTVPNARGWFGADVVRQDGGDKIAVAGGLGEDNQRLNDVWLLSFE